MTFKHTLTSVLLSLLVSGIAQAAGAPPANVKNVQGFIVDGTLRVTWDPPADPSNVASYRIYYSHQSILGNSGDYDDFEQTNDAADSYAFDSLPLSSPVIFIGVLAVSKEGVESEGFEVEASVPIPADLARPAEPENILPSSSSSSAPESSSSSSPSSPSLSPPQILTAEAESETGVLLTFDKELQRTSPLMPFHFQVSDTGGTLLPIFSVKQPDTLHVVLITAAHRPDTTYIISLVAPVAAQDGSIATPGQQIEFRSKMIIQVAAPTETIAPPSPTPATEYGKNPAFLIHEPEKSIVPPVSPTNDTELPGSGIGLMGVLIAAGAATGRMIGRRKSGER
ncbi:MAG: hypothetical protein PHZ00_04435 [Candidatus Peribacteraceae bacterium]|nr:hypothetical protein [Candidatus Peribacteraceae bacterium]